MKKEMVKKVLALCVLSATVVGCEQVGNLFNKTEEVKVVQPTEVSAEVSAKDDISTSYERYLCANDVKVELSKVAVNGEVKTITTKVNGQPYGVMELSNSESNEDSTIYVFKERRVIFADGGKVFNQITEDMNNIVAKACELKEKQ